MGCYLTLMGPQRVHEGSWLAAGQRGGHPAGDQLLCRLLDHLLWQSLAWEWGFPILVAHLPAKLLQCIVTSIQGLQINVHTCECSAEMKHHSKHIDHRSQSMWVT